jgi:hypothetical protein
LELLNQTLAAARLFTGFTNPTSGVAALVVRRTYRIGDDGALLPSDEPWPIFSEPLQTDVGVFPSDMTPAHAGCDLVIAGIARSAEPVTSVAVSAAVGAFSTRLQIIGHRVWQGRDGDLVPGEPEPFTEMPLGWAAAYGGVSDHEGMPAPYPLNAEGKGFYLKREQAKGRPLPNLEWPHAPIRALVTTSDIETSTVALRDYDWEKPSFVLQSRVDTSDPLFASEGKLEAYGYEIGLFATDDVGKQRATEILQGDRALLRTFACEASFALAPGTRMGISGHPSDEVNGDALVTRSRISGHVDQGGSARMSHVLECIPASTFFRPRRRPKPRIYGTQTAFVVGKQVGNTPLQIPELSAQAIDEITRK